MADAMSREQYISVNTQMFAELTRDIFLGSDGVESLSEFAKGIESHAREANRKCTVFINKQFSDDAHRKEFELTRLADQARTALRRIAELKDDVAKLQINGNDPSRRLKAATTMGFLRSYCEAIENYIL